MRRTAVIVILAVLACSAAFAQQTTAKDVYVKTVRIAKVYPHGLGYRILYFKSTLEYAEMYVPTAWFSFGGGGNQTIFGSLGVLGHVVSGAQVWDLVPLDANPASLSDALLDDGIERTQECLQRKD